MNEILGLEECGLQLAIFSLRKPAAEPSHPALGGVRSTVDYVPSLSWKFWPAALGVLVFHHLVLLLTETRRYIAAARAYFHVKGSSRVEDFLQAGYLARALRRGKVTHLHAHFANVPATVAEVVHHLTGIPFSFTAHAKDIYLTPSAELGRKIESATCVLTCTAYNQRYLASLARANAPIHLAYHGVDSERFGRSRTTLIANSKLPLILSVGRFCEKKGLEYLIRACRSLADDGYAFRCQIVGYGELRNKLEQLIHDLDLTHCVFLSGSMTQDQLAALYPQASIFVLPCVITDQGDRDGIPNVLIEAMISEVPVISTDVSGVSELVDHGRNGLLVEPRNTSTLAEAIKLLLLRPELRRRLALNGRDTVLQRFTLQASAQHVHNILSSILSAGISPASSRGAIVKP